MFAWLRSINGFRTVYFALFIYGLIELATSLDNILRHFREGVVSGSGECQDSCGSLYASLLKRLPDNQAAILAAAKFARSTVALGAAVGDLGDMNVRIHLPLNWPLIRHDRV